MDYPSLKIELTKRSESNPDIVGLAIAGSYVRNTQKPDSDIDVCLFVSNPDQFISNPCWAEFFGGIQSTKIEDWGVVKTLRVFYKHGPEVEFNFSTLAWADIPVDPGTHRVVADGIDILYDPTERLSTLQHHVCA
ncbi:nucleotidyltransferase domain-containing protein [Veronia pacifica]|uniref:Polymerase nucleotidyl transferase domain-containing protein n=1 Tax=Veronia pacifica TaxID=1080227 RepID=A0A1C3EAI7_9GAMM|nr:nucleotidyltransferase domain-containing protein [Veronia pacifica]ODA30229.1 hypothetical protein A8L45_20720 [Veronia pacifica]